MTGSRCGSEGGCRVPLALSAFRDDEGGFTTVAMALALLLSVTLAFSAAAAGWVASRSSQVQRVADATAVAGANVVASFSTVAQVLDACVLSMGLAGLVTLGAGLVVSCVPGLSVAGAELCATGGRVLESRRGLARSSAEGLERLEGALPALIVANSASCASANSEGSISYLGCAVPLPVTSASDFSALEAEVSDEGLEGLSAEMRAASEELEAASARAREALERGWLADCGSEPHCLWERAETLAGLSPAENPRYVTADSWTFGAPLARARRYYAARLAAQRVEGESAEELTDAACRRAFYAYALDRVREGSYVERADGTVVADLPSLPSSADETRETELFVSPDWPCTMEGGARTLHCATSCPGALGEPAGNASLADLDRGVVSRCAACGMDVGELGRVAAASTPIANGFEHHWEAIVEASEDYERAVAERAEAESRLKELAERGADDFDRALDQLAVERPALCPPGAWGCVAVVGRGEGATVPTELTRAFLSDQELPAGVAVSAATLAPDDETAENNVLSSFLDALVAGDSVLAGAADGVLGLWGELLVGYGSAAHGAGEVASEFLDGLDGVLGGSVGAWLRDRLSGIVEAAGLAPVDMRLRRPVLVNTQDVLDQAGLDHASGVRELLAALPDSASVEDLARSLGVPSLTGGAGGRMVVAEVPLPGTGVSIPLSVDLSRLAGAA